MLAVAFAYEISRKARTLLVDLDFFNRGLTGLMRHGTRIQTLPQPTFLSTSDIAPGESDSWELVEVAPNVVHLRYPDLLPDQITALEEAETKQLAASLKEWLAELRAASGCQVIVIDCHGGPDKLSFAACLVSDHSIMVSEPDKITFYGTLHFIRQLERVTSPGDSKPDLRLVFNKVVPAFSAPFLTKFYNTQVKENFNANPLLAIFPLEVYLTKEFEKTPFLTAVYPFSQLAKKTRVLILDLLLPRCPKLAKASVHTHSRIRLWLTRRSLGRTPRILDLNHVMSFIAAISIVAAALNLYFKYRIALVEPNWFDFTLRTVYKYLADRVELLIGTAVLWFAAALLINWSAALDRSFTYQSRRHRRSLATALLLIASLLWFFPLVVTGTLANDVSGSSFNRTREWLPYGAAVLTITIVATDQLVKIFQNVLFEKRLVEAAARTLFLIYVIVTPVIVFISQ